MKRIVAGAVLVIGGVCAGAPALFHGSAAPRALVTPARAVVAPYHRESSARVVRRAHMSGYHQESSVRAVRTAHGYRVVARSR